MSQFNRFDVLNHAIEPGACLVEASAGTGKTFSIAFVVLRLVVEKNIPIENILLVTFTEAATQELRERVRARLLAAKNAIQQDSPVEDVLLAQWVVALVDKDEALARLLQALAEIDQANISTIHGFCQKVLSEFPLESAQGFGQSLMADLSALEQEVVEDYWRQLVYVREASQVALITEALPNPQALQQFVGHLQQGPLQVTPEPMALDAYLHQALQEREQWHDWLEHAQPKINTFMQQAQQQGWISQRSQAKLLALWQGFNEHSIEFFDYFLSGKAFLKKAQGFWQDLLDDLALDPVLFEAQRKITPQLRMLIQADFAQVFAQQLQAKLAQANEMGFNDLILRLHHALYLREGTQLLSSVRAQYQAALIDEFQDTDQWQWGIFSRLFNHSSHYLYLIGDPKQAIYKFRGADIHAYFKARAECKTAYTLDTNWRSVPRLVKAVNQVFARDNPFKLEPLVFHAVEAASEQDNGVAWHWWRLPPRGDDKPWTKTAADERIQQAVLAKVVELIQTQHVKPQQMAVLVRTNARAQGYQKALAALGVPAVVKARESVFQTEQARQLYRVMAAMVYPNDAGRIKPLLALDWFGLDAQQVHGLLHSEALEAWFESFQVAHECWQKQSFICALYGVLSEFKVMENLTVHKDAERRIANIYQLAELVQTAINRQHLSAAKALEFLQNQITQADGREDSLIRLDRDDEALQIVTVHAAKGLEYDYVFCPDLWREPNLTQSGPVRFYHDDTWYLDLGSAQFEAHKEQARLEQQAEDLRLLYVALTRARLCHFVVSGEGIKDTQHASLAYLHRDHYDPELFSETLLTEVEAVSPISPEPAPEVWQVRAWTRAQVDKRHRLFSFTGLVKAGHHGATQALRLMEEMPVDKAQEAETIQPKVEFDPHKQLARGAHFGNLVHDMLEQQDFAAIARQPDPELRQRLCDKYGLAFKPYQHDVFDKMMQRVVSTPFGGEGLSLAELDAHCVLKEMAFYYRLRDSSTEQINQLMPKKVPFLPLSEQALSGYLNGFIDLVFERQGRYYVLDYKTNFLGNEVSDYHQQAMFSEMQQHRYGLQFMLYSLALHQYLSQRVADYDYEDHFGGVYYLFVRGMNGVDAQTGVYHYRPQKADIEALSECLQSANGGQHV